MRPFWCTVVRHLVPDLFGMSLPGAIRPCPAYSITCTRKCTRKPLHAVQASVEC